MYRQKEALKNWTKWSPPAGPGRDRRLTHPLQVEHPDTPESAGHTREPEVQAPQSLCCPSLKPVQILTLLHRPKDATRIYLALNPFSNACTCTLVSRMNCHSSTASPKSLCRAGELHHHLANTWRRPLTPHSGKDDGPVAWPAVPHWDVNIFFGLPVQELSKLPFEALVWFWSACAHVHMPSSRAMKDW